MAQAITDDDVRYITDNIRHITIIRPDGEIEHRVCMKKEVDVDVNIILRGEKQELQRCDWVILDWSKIWNLISRRKLYILKSNFEDSPPERTKHTLLHRQSLTWVRNEKNQVGSRREVFPIYGSIVAVSKLPPRPIENWTPSIKQLIRWKEDNEPIPVPPRVPPRNNE